MWSRAPVSCARITSRATIVASLAQLIPGTPISVETAPSCIAPPAESVWSSQWLITGTPRSPASSIARR
jgi:hypothetical protein